MEVAPSDSGYTRFTGEGFPNRKSLPEGLSGFAIEVIDERTDRLEPKGFRFLQEGED